MTLDALTPSSPKCLNQLCLTVFSSLRSSRLLVHIFLPNFFLPVNFAFNMLWYSTPWTATPFSNDPLWLTLFLPSYNFTQKRLRSNIFHTKIMLTVMFMPCGFPVFSAFGSALFTSFESTSLQEISAFFKKNKDKKKLFVVINMSQKPQLHSFRWIHKWLFSPNRMNERHSRMAMILPRFQLPASIIFRLSGRRRLTDVGGEHDVAHFVYVKQVGW